MSRLFGWSLPPGCTMGDIDRATGSEGPLDCPVCSDGVELDGPDCSVDPIMHGVTCKIHGCIICQNLETKRQWCPGMCNNYLRPDQPYVEYEGKRYCSEGCKLFMTTPEVQEPDMIAPDEPEA